jgi:hypothetical protein
MSRHADLMRQGFMRPMREARPKREPPPMVACERCQNWHRKGKHTWLASALVAMGVAIAARGSR